MQQCSCGAEWKTRSEGTSSTYVGYITINGHLHDDNCVKKFYYCSNGHRSVLSKRQECSRADCNWVGKEDCDCHDGKKVEEWPEVQTEGI